MSETSHRFAAWTSASVDALSPTGMAQRTGVIVFADISGFTALTEHLRRTSGQRGVETLTDRISGIFESMIAEVHRSGGQVLKFGGDALLISFEGEGALARALNCSHGLHGIARRNSRLSRGRRLALHAGLASGQWCECVAGAPGRRREHFVFGPALIEALDQADAAKDGQTRLWMRGQSVREITGDGTKRVAPHSWLVGVRPRRAESRTGDSEYPVPARTAESPADFVPEQLREILANCSFDPLRSGEHRRVCTMFVFLKGFGSRAGDAAPAAIWDGVFKATHETVSAHAGLWARSDPGSGYQKLLILFGSPVAADDDVDRAIGCAVALRDRLSEFRGRQCRWRFGIGLTTQSVFTGFVGSCERMEFTAMGDGVNLAARLAAKARHREILVDEATRRSTKTWDFAHGPKLKLKGITDPVRTSSPKSRRPPEDARVDDDVIEHPRALAIAAQAWDESGFAPLLIVASDEADSRRFVSQFLSRHHDPKERVCRIAFSTQDGVAAHGGLLRFLVQLLQKADPRDLRTRLMPFEPPATPRMWNAVLGDERALGRLLARFGMEAYSRYVAEGICRVLRDSDASTGRTCVVLERVERLSDLDQGVFKELIGHRLDTFRFIVTRHTAGNTAADENQSAIILGAIDKMEMREVLLQVLPEEAISARLLGYIHTKSGGVVRLARLYLDSLRREGHLAPSGKGHKGWRLGELTRVELPDSLRAHFIQRLDQIPRHCTHVARALAVLGDSTTRDALNALCMPEMDPKAIEEACQRLESFGLVAFEHAPAGMRITIPEPKFRQAAYETMSFAQREAFHRRAMQHSQRMGRSGVGEAGQHAFLAREFDTALPLLMREASRTHRSWMFEMAQKTYRWALLCTLNKSEDNQKRLLPALPRMLADAQIAVLKPLAEILRERGLYPEAARIHARLANSHERRRKFTDASREQLAAARLDWLAGRYPIAERRAATVLRAARSRRTGLLVAEAHLLLGEIMRRTGRLQRAETHLARAIAMFTSKRRFSLLADAHNSRGIVAWNQGQLKEASAHFRTALSLLRSRRDLPRRGQIANNLGILHEESGSLPRAERFYRRAFEVFDSMGHRRNRAYCLGNLANLHRHGARFEAARAAYEEAELELRTMGELHAAAYTWGNLGDLYRDFGQWEKAKEFYDRTAAFARRVEDHELISESYSRLGELAIVDRDWRRARVLLDNATDAADEAKSKEFRLRADILKADLWFRRGKLELAAELLRTCADSASHSGYLYYSLWAGVVRAHVAVAMGDRREAHRLAANGLRSAQRTGYCWWEFHFAVLCAQSEGIAGRIETPAGAVISAARKASSLHDRIFQSIGDPSVRISFEETPVVRASRSPRGLALDVVSRATA